MAYFARFVCCFSSFKSFDLETVNKPRVVDANLRAASFPSWHSGSLCLRSLGSDSLTPHSD